MSTIKLSPSQTGYLLGISERTIRRAIKNEELTVEIHNSRYKIDFADALKWSNQLPNRRNKRDTIGIGQYIHRWKIDVE